MNICRCGKTVRVILKRIYADIIRLTTTPEQGKALADFIRQTADEFEEQNNVETLLSELETAPLL